MRLPDPKIILFNAAAVVVTAAAVFAAVKSMLVPPTAAPCSERYLNMTAFALERGGVLLTAAELQAAVAGRDAGVIDNVAIARVDDAPAPLAMAVSLPKGSASPHAASGARGGVSFPWEPRALAGKTSACLSYHVRLAADFDFNRGGALPGLAGAEAGERGDRFLARLAWRPNAAGGVTLRVSDGGVARTMVAERSSFDFPRGRWVRLEQEVVLNTPKANDGTLRVWVDGALVIERNDIAYRAKSDVSLTGVSADVYYGTEDGREGAPRDTKVWLSPFEVRWQQGG